jgi:hypothetical protein
MVFASWDYKHFTPAGLKALYFKGLYKNPTLISLEKGEKT